MDYTNSYTTAPDGAALGALAAFSGFLFIFAVLAYVLTSLGLMQFFKKANKPGWAAWVPFYNYYIMTQVAGIPLWWFWLFIASVLLAWIPLLGSLVTLVTGVYITHMFLQKFGKDTGHTILAVLFPFVYFPVVGYSKELTYKGSPTSATASPSDQVPPTTPQA